MFKVYAWDKPRELGGVETYIADIELASKPTTANWGDKCLFFRHQFWEDTNKIHPEWEEYAKQGYIYRDEDELRPDSTSTAGGCPFADMYLQ